MIKPIRKFWLRDSKTDLRWNLTPENPYIIENGCPLISPKGVGYEQNVEQTQADIDYFITKVNSKNKSITGTLLFFNDNHLNNFKEWIGDFKKQFELHYSPDGSIIAEDMVSKSWYKPVVITLFDKGEKNKDGYYEISVTFSTQSDVWRRDIELEFSPIIPYGDPHVYPYYYPYYYGGQTVLATNITNNGSETPLVINITNISTDGTIITNPEWIVESIEYDILGNEFIQRQKAKFNVQLLETARLEVDSRPIQQHAYIYYKDNIENVKNLEEPDYAYIGYVTLKNGVNRIIFNMTNAEKYINIIVSYSEMSEVV